MPLSHPSGGGCLSSSPTHPWLRAAPGTTAAQDFILPCELATGPHRPEEAALAVGRGFTVGLRIMKAGGT